MTVSLHLTEPGNQVRPEIFCMNSFLMQDIGIHYQQVEEMEECTAPPFDGAVSKPIEDSIWSAWLTLPMYVLCSTMTILSICVFAYTD